MLYYFMIYSFLGWVIEVSYHAVTLGKVVNRGFLNGPICPVYGVGVSLVLLTVQGLGRRNIETSNPLVLFIIGIVLATGAELIAGYLLDKLFHARWWDYSKEKFNLGGYICLSFSLIWGLAIAFVLRVIQPVIALGVSRIPMTFAYISLTIFYIVFIVDIVLTTMSVLKLNKQLEQVANLKSALLLVSDNMSEVIGNETIKAMSVINDTKEKSTEKRAELERKLEDLKNDFTRHTLFGKGRLLRALPEIHHKKYDEIIRWIKERK